MKVNIKMLKIAMARKQFNSADLARVANVTNSSINYILTGKRNPTTKMLGVIAAALEVDVTELIEE